MKDHGIKPFYVGQEVVANCNNPGWFKAGDDFTINSIQLSCCGWDVTIGLRFEVEGRYKCKSCGAIAFRRANEEAHFAVWRFSPKLEIKGFISMAELAEKQLEQISAN